MYYIAAASGHMKKTATEKNVVIVLFIAVLVIFSMAERDSKKLTRLYVAVTKTVAKSALVKAKPSPQTVVIPTN